MAESMAWEERVFNLSGVPTLFAKTGLLWVMRSRVLETTLAHLTTADDEEEEEDNKKGHLPDDKDT
jgi:hypothetical protein